MSRKVIGLLHNVPVPAGTAFSEASSDILTQVEAIEEAIKNLGYLSIRMPFTRNITGLILEMRKVSVAIAVNLVETLDDDPRFTGHSAAILELLDIPFSGSPFSAIMLTTDKVMTKRLLMANGIKTPNYMIYNGKGNFDFHGLRYPVILKPALQDASIGIDQESIFKHERSLKEGIEGFFNRFGTILVEEYINGRELNVSIFGYPSPRVLPIAEIDFSAFPENLFPIAGYRAKWDKSSFEYCHSPRKFPQQELPAVLREKIESIALECFHLLMLRDYGRVDIRLDDQGQIYVLEVNANPCLSPDAGFAGAIYQDGMSYTDMVRQLINFTEQRAVNNRTPLTYS